MVATKGREIMECVVYVLEGDFPLCVKEQVWKEEEEEEEEDKDYDDDDNYKF